MFLAAQLPNLAGLVLAFAITAVLCVAYHAVRAVIDKQQPGGDVVVGGVIVAVVIGAVGLVLVAAGLPGFK